MKGEEKTRMSLKERLYLQPLEKYKKYNLFPWELLVTILLIILTTSQVILVVQMSSTYSYSQILIWNQMFLNNDVNGDDEAIVNSYNLYSQRDLTNYIKSLVGVRSTQKYYNINTYTFDDYEYQWDDGEKEPPKLLVRYINNGRTNGHKYETEYNLTRIDLGPFATDKVKEFMNIVSYFEIRFSIKQHLPRDMPLPDECYHWYVKQYFDFSYRGSVESSQSLVKRVCGGYEGNSQVANVWKNYHWISIALGIVSAASLLLVWTSFKERMKMVSKLKSVNSWRDLEFSEKAKFFNVSNLITIVGNLCQFFSIFHAGFLLAISNPDFVFSTFEVLAGIGCFCAWINIVIYLDHTTESFIVVNTFKRSYNVLLLYMLGLFPIYLAYAHLGMTLFWQSGYFLDILGSMMILFAMLNGDSIYFFFSTCLPINYFFAQLFFYSFVVLFIW